MAQYQHLPIYKSVYELLQLITRLTGEFPKTYRYSLGDKLRLSKDLRRSTVRKAFDHLDGLCRSKQPPNDIATAANSYLGLFRRADAWRTRSRLAQLLRHHGHLVSPTLNRMFEGAST